MLISKTRSARMQPKFNGWVEYLMARDSIQLRAVEYEAACE